MHQPHASQLNTQAPVCIYSRTQSCSRGKQQTRRCPQSMAAQLQAAQSQPMTDVISLLKNSSHTGVQPCYPLRSVWCTLAVANQTDSQYNVCCQPTDGRCWHLSHAEVHIERAVHEQLTGFNALLCPLRNPFLVDDSGVPIVSEVACYHSAQMLPT